MPGLLYSVPLISWRATVNPHLHQRLLNTPGHFQASLAQSLVGSLFLSPGSWCAQSFVSALQESVSPVLWKSCNQNPLDMWITTNWKILEEIGIPGHLTCLLRNLYAGQKATVSHWHGTTDRFQIGKGVHQGCILSPCLFNFYAEYIMWNARLDEVQVGVKIAWRNTNNFSYADDTTLMAESEEELKSLLMKVKEESEKVGLKISIQKTKIMASGPITSWQIDGKQ